jgi:enoyl-CoA hydratase
MEYRLIILEKKEHIAKITINRPQQLNALNIELLKELECAVYEVKEDPELYVLIITGAGEKAFVAGADITGMKDMTVKEAIEFASMGQRVFNSIENLPIPVIAVVNGFALGGGCELALACDIVIASRDAKFGQPEVNLGVIPGFGGTQRLPRVVSKNKAKELIFTGDMITADEAMEIGMVNKVVDGGKLMEEAEAMAKKILSRGPVAVKYAKRAINYGIEAGLYPGLELEKTLFANLFVTEDQREGMRAFVEKRKPVFKGK